MKRIGKGTFTTCYTDESDASKVILKSLCPVKEVTAIYDLGDGVRIPKIELIDHFFYRMKFYSERLVKSKLAASEWELYKVLRSLKPFFYASDVSPYNHYRGEFQKLRNKFPDVYHTIEEYYNELTILGDDVCFEISPRNVRIEDGRLILLDCFFSRQSFLDVAKKSIKK